MKTTDRLRKHHKDLLLIFDELMKTITDRKRPNIDVLRKDMSFLEGKLKIHLSMEDKDLYPKLMNHGDGKIRDLTERYKREMITVYDSFHAISVRCREEGYFREKYDEFVEEIGKFVEVLKVRIAMEDEALFPLLDGLEEEGGESC